MSGQEVNRFSGTVLIGLSLIALLTVVTGYFQPPQLDESATAHIFQLSVAAVIPVLLLFIATADWKERWRGLRPLALSAMALAVAFAALYYLEHYYYLQHYH